MNTTTTEKPIMITGLGEAGTTFTYDALLKAGKIFGLPEIITEGNDANYIEVKSNENILPTIAKYEGFGAIAMENRAEGRVGPSVDSFASLLKLFRNNDECPFTIIGALRMKIHFALMVRKGNARFQSIVSHKKGLGACKNKIVALGYKTEEADNNGEAAKKVAQLEEYANWAAIGPKSAAKRFGLEIISEEYEDSTAFTTFFIIGPKDHATATGKENRMILVARAPENKPGAMVNMMIPFKTHQVNFAVVTSAPFTGTEDVFFFQPEASDLQLENLSLAVEESRKHMSDHLVFGPFVVVNC